MSEIACFLNQGAKNPPDQLERTLLFKKELLTRNRIVTVEDIRLFCKAELGKDLDKVIIKKDPIMGTEPEYRIPKLHKGSC